MKRFFNHFMAAVEYAMDTKFWLVMIYLHVSDSAPEWRAGLCVITFLLIALKMASAYMEDARKVTHDRSEQ